MYTFALANAVFYFEKQKPNFSHFWIQEWLGSYGAENWSTKVNKIINIKEIKKKSKTLNKWAFYWISLVIKI